MEKPYNQLIITPSLPYHQLIVASLYRRFQLSVIAAFHMCIVEL